MEGNLSPAVVKSKRVLLVNLAAFFPLDSLLMFECGLGRKVQGAGAPHLALGAAHMPLYDTGSALTRMEGAM